MKKDNSKITVIIAAIPAAALVFAVFAVRQIDNVGKFALRNADTAAPTTKVPDYVPATTRADEVRADGGSLIPRAYLITFPIRAGLRELRSDSNGNGDGDMSSSHETFAYRPIGEVVEDMLRHDHREGYDANYNKFLLPASSPSVPFARSKPSDSVLLVPNRYRETGYRREIRRYRMDKGGFSTSNQ